MNRLSARTLESLSSGISVPKYIDQSVCSYIVHLGVGAFHRAHEAEYLHELLNDHTNESSWRIIGASLRSASVYEQLAPQDFLYTLETKDSESGEASVIGVIESVIVAQESPKKLVETLSDKKVKIVSLTITEKGYYLDPASGTLMMNHPDIVHDLNNTTNPQTAVGFLVAALKNRKERGIAPFTVLCCDNLPSNGLMSKNMVLDFSRQIDSSLATWIESAVSFPSSMVDRIVPATTEAGRVEFQQKYGYRDEALVTAEPFKQWVIEDTFSGERPAWEKVGVLMVDDVQQFETMKLRLLNGCHSTLAYLGYLANIDTISEVMQEKIFVDLMKHMMKAEITPTLSIPNEINIKEYQECLILRFKNTSLKHRTWQIAMDGSQKLPQRLLQTIRDQRKMERCIEALSLAIAAWICYARGLDLQGKVIDVVDPMAKKFESIRKTAGEDAKALVGQFFEIDSIFDSTLSTDTFFVDKVTQWVESLFAVGVKESIKQCLNKQEMDLPPVVKIHSDDNVAVTLQEMVENQIYDHLTIQESIPVGHKLSLKKIDEGDTIIKYGHPIGRATKTIPSGSWVHEHNLATSLSPEDTYHYHPQPTAPKDANDLSKKQTFEGYRRSNGKVGIRNEIWVLPTVGCVNKTASLIAHEGFRRYQNVHAFTHPFGCSQLGGDLQQTQSILAALAQHPNAGGVIIIGLGCENNQLSSLISSMDGADLSRIKFFNAQEVDDEVQVGLSLIDELEVLMQSDRRSPCPMSDLVIGVKCGGSDAYSGMTANPLVGMVTDRLVTMGGAVLMTEVPEMFGAEQLLMNRAVSEHVYSKLVRMVQEFKQYFLEHKQPVYENPSPGNKKGGITTLEEKSLGAIQKGGQSPVSDLLGYGEVVRSKGLSLLESPGNDAVSCTALTAAGSHIVLFTTGRGTPLGFPVPTIKISTNKDLFVRKKHWIDFDSWEMLHQENHAYMLNQLYSMILETASGKHKTHNETNDCREIAIWKRGVTL